MSSEPADKRAKRSLVLGYWDIRGLAQPIRLLLKYSGTEFEDFRYMKGQDWTKDKQTLGFDFPNLPYLIDGDLKLTQSNAIIAYLARKTNLAGNKEDETLVDMLANVAMDFRNGFIRQCYSSKEDFDAKREDYVKNAKASLKRFSDFLSDKPWFVGQEITYVDIIFYELMDQHRMFEPTILDDYDNLKAFLDRFEALPAIKAYMESPEFQRYPVNGSHAAWSGVKE